MEVIEAQRSWSWRLTIASTSSRIGWARVVVGAGLRLVAERAHGRSMAGTCGVTRRSIAVMSVAGRSLPGWPARSGARQLPAVSSRRFPLRGNRACQRTVAGPRGPSSVPVLGSPGNLWRGCERWQCGSDFQGGTVSGACPARGRTGIGCGRLVAQRRARPDPGQQWGNEMQQDSAGLDGT